MVLLVKIVTLNSNPNLISTLVLSVSHYQVLTERLDEYLNFVILVLCLMPKKYDV